jgi:hypothetical protein
MIDDRTLVSQILSGDKQAFRALIKQNERLVGHMVGRLIDQHEDREELCQDVFMKVYEKLGGNLLFQSKLSTWIATIAYRQGHQSICGSEKIAISDFTGGRKVKIERFYLPLMMHPKRWADQQTGTKMVFCFY